MSRKPLRDLLLAHTLSDIRDICNRLGLNKTGTKATLASRVHDAVRDAPPLPPKARILSIDLGLRNLAFSLLETPAVPSTGKVGKRPRLGNYVTAPWESDAGRTPPKLLEWNVVALVPGSNGAVPPAETPALDVEDAPTESDDAGTKPGETFSPAALATVAVTAVRDLIMPLKPTHILLERQRWRSGGGPVLEWTLRINSLEAMLHAALELMRAEGSWAGEVHSVEPKRVAGSIGEEAEDDVDEIRKLTQRGKKTTPWLKPDIEFEEEAPPEEDRVIVMGKKQSVKRVKKERIARVVEEALERTSSADADEVLLTLGSDTVREKAMYYLQKVKGKKAMEILTGSTKGVAAPADWQQLAKVDDLADSLLQGLAWWEWQMNRRDLHDETVLERLAQAYLYKERKKEKKSAAKKSRAAKTSIPKKASSRKKP